MDKKLPQRQAPKPQKEGKKSSKTKEKSQNVDFSWPGRETSTKTETIKFEEELKLKENFGTRGVSQANHQSEYKTKYREWDIMVRRKSYLSDLFSRNQSPINIHKQIQ